MTIYTQTGKPMRVKTPLATDMLLLERLRGSEKVSAPFEITLDLISPESSIDPKAVLGHAVTVTIDLPGGKSRYFHGFVQRFAQGGRTAEFVSYEATVVPSIWFLSLISDCRVFQSKSVPDIVKSILDEAGMNDYRLSLVGSYPQREYCVQYRETDLDFISRLLEEEGIFYFFEHTAEKHTVVFADSSSAVKPGPVAKLPVTFAEEGHDWGEFLLDVEIGTAVGSGAVSLADYNDTEPKQLSASVRSRGGSGDPKFAVYDYPGKFGVLAEGDRLARIRLEECEAQTHVIRGRAHTPALGSGQKLDVANHYRRDVNTAYQLLSLEHDGQVGGYRSDSTSDDEAFRFESSFLAMPHATPFRPARTTPKSVVHGSQTALVVGPGGEEIYVDKYGRVKVQFFWDRMGKKDEQSSCWVRVSSTWAGKQWGAIQIPRIGQEVVVDFLEGDPDRPIITGRVYNGEQMPPYALPANGTQSGVKSRSSKGGQASEANELRFEDKIGSEEVYAHAQKDLKTVVVHDELRDVGNDRTTTIDNNETKTITKGDEKITLKKGSQTITIYKDQSVKLEMGDMKTEIAMGNSTTAVKMGNMSIKADLGKIGNEAMQSIELKVGQSSIKVDQMGVTIKGMMIKIEGQVQTEVKGLMTNVSASAMLAVKGSITMIN